MGNDTEWRASKDLEGVPQDLIEIASRKAIMQGHFLWHDEYCRQGDNVKESWFPILFLLSLLSSFSLHVFNVRTLTVDSSKPERATPSLPAECHENHQEP
jgi:hypothetical protein